MRRTITRLVPIVQRRGGRTFSLSSAPHLLLASRLQRLATARFHPTTALLRQQLRPLQYVQCALRLLRTPASAHITGGDVRLGCALAFARFRRRQNEGGFGVEEEGFGFAGCGVLFERFQGQIFVDAGF